MSLVTKISDLILAIKAETKALRSYISGSVTGNTGGLTTTATNLVGAINEVKATADNASTATGNTDLSPSFNAVSYTIESSTGVNAVITAATSAKAGIFTSADYNWLYGIEQNADRTDASNVSAAGATMFTANTLAGAGYFLDEDGFTSDSPTKVASQQSIKAYVANQLASRQTTTAAAGQSTADRQRANHTGTQPANTVAGLAVVATSGSYNDLANKPDLSVLNDVVVLANLGAFPATGDTDKVYIAEDTGSMYRWNGTGYTELTDTTAVWGQVSGVLANQTDLIAALNAKLSRTGGVMVGDINMDDNFIVSGFFEDCELENTLNAASNKITFLANGTAVGDAVNLGQLNLKFNKTGGDLSGDLGMLGNNIDMGDGDIENITELRGFSNIINLETRDFIGGDWTFLNQKIKGLANATTSGDAIHYGQIGDPETDFVSVWNAA